jgi:hypothetical protein
MQLNNPVHKKSVPTVGGDSPAASGDRFSPAPLSQTAIAFLKRSLARNQRRRGVYRASRLRVCIDGEERVQYDPEVGIYEPFRVPLTASYLEIFGDDEDGDLLLAMFPLHEPEGVEDAEAQQMFVTFERGQMVTIEVALSDGTGGEEREYVIHLSYSESPAGDMGGAANPAVEVPPESPRSEPSTPWNQQISTSYRPNDHGEADRVAPRRRECTSMLSSPTERDGMRQFRSRFCSGLAVNGAIPQSSARARRGL